MTVEATAILTPARAARGQGLRELDGRGGSGVSTPNLGRTLPTSPQLLGLPVPEAMTAAGADEEYPAIRKLGRLFRVTEVHLW
jgi:hypothetical protein